MIHVIHGEGDMIISGEISILQDMGFGDIRNEEDLGIWKKSRERRARAGRSQGRRRVRP